MRKYSLALISIFAFLLAPTFSFAQTWTPSAPQNTKINRIRQKRNAQICQAHNLPNNCTQGQARDAFCQQLFKTNAPCTGSGNISVPADIQAFLDKTMPDIVQAWTEELRKDDAETDCEIWQAQTRAQKDATCAAMTPPRPSGCELCK